MKLERKSRFVIRAAFMPIRRFLGGHKFDGETIRLMGIAFEMALAAFRETDIL